MSNQPRMHPTYNLLDGNIYIRAENTMFRIHRYFLERESQYFRDRLTSPVLPKHPAPGTTYSNPLTETVTVSELEKFLWVFYKEDYYNWDASTEDWKIILKLAHQWKFDRVKSLALRKLEKKDIDLVDRLIMYQAYEAGNKFLVPRLAELCVRNEFLTIEEGDRLGMQTTILIARVREVARSEVSNDLPHICAQISNLLDEFGATS